MRKVFTNAMTFHVFCAQSQDEGRNGNRSISFSGSLLRSYAAPIARIVFGRSGRQVMLVTYRRYSVTTQQHINAARSAYEGTSIVVARIGDSPELRPDEHEANLAYLEQRHAENAVRLLRQVSAPWRPYEESLAETERIALEYSDLFGLRAPNINTAADLARINENRAKRLKRQNQPAQVWKRTQREQAERIRQAERERHMAEYHAQRAAEREKLVPRWRAREVHTLGDTYGMPTLLRYNPDEAYVETSRGAHVPVEDAIRAFAVVRRCREAATAWTPQGDSVRLGHFTLDHVDAQGNIKAGCHNIAWDEIERLANERGW